MCALAFVLLQSWNVYQPWVVMAPQAIGAWGNLSAAQRLLLQGGGTVNNFNSGICSGANPILLNITSGPAPNAATTTAINARQPRRWGNNSFFLARQNMGSAGVQYCFDLSIAAPVALDSREHAFFSNGENIRISALNGVNPVTLTAAYQGPVGNATITGNGTGNVHFNANGKLGGGLWWSANTGAQPVTKVCIQYYAPAGELPSVEPFRLSIEGVKCVADPAITCGGASPVSRWGWMESPEGLGLDIGQPVQDFQTGFCDESGDPINFMEIDADPSTGSGAPNFLNNRPPRTYGRYSFDNTRETINAGGNMYCFTLDEARPLRVNSKEHRFFAGPERVRVKAWLGADAVSMTGGGNAPAPTINASGITFSGSSYGKGIWWEATTGNQPVTKVCVEYWRTNGAGETGEPFAIELCAPRCQYDDLYACTLAPPNTSGACAIGFPSLLITKTVTPVNSYGLNTCTGNGTTPVFKVRLSMYNNAGGLKELFLYDDLNFYFGTAYGAGGIVSAPQITYSTATGPPMLNPFYDGVDQINLFYPGTGWLSAGQELVVEFDVALNPNVPGALSAMCNTAFGGGNAGSYIATDLSGDLGGGFGNPTVVNNLPSGVVATPAQDVTLEATMTNYFDGPQNWVNNHGGASFSVPGCGPTTWTSDFDMENWVFDCSFIDGHIDVTFTGTNSCGYVFTTCATYTLVDTEGPSCIKPTNLDLNCGDPDAAADLDHWLNYEGNWSDASWPVTFTHDFTGLPPNSCNGQPIKVTWTGTDNCGNQTIFIGYLTITDGEDPVLQNVPTTLHLTDCGNIPPPANVTATDACDPNVQVTFSETSSGPTCDRIIIRTWTATDDCGNTATGSQTIYVADNQPPVLNGAPSGELTLTPCEQVPAPPTVTATDPCTASLPVNYQETSSGPACSLTINRSWVVYDDCGNAGFSFQTIHIVDNQPPVFSNVPANVTAECPNVPPVQTPTVTDCSAVNVVFSETQTGGACPLPNIITRTWTATDACGLVTTATQVITMTQIVIPSSLTFTFVPSNITTTCDQNPGFGTPVAVTTCPAGGLAISSSDVVNNPGGCSQPFSITRTWIAHDACGNMATASQTISTGPDTQVPTFASNTPTSLTIDCGGALNQPVAFDNCGATTLSYVDSGQTGTCTTGFNFTRTWKATDVCGNSSTFAQQITTTPDTTPPTFTFVPFDQFFDCDEPINFPSPIAFDNCGDVTITFQDSIIGTGDCHEVNGVWYGYDIVRTWKATDECGNSTTAITNAWVLPGFNNGNRIAFSYVPANRIVDCTGNAVFGTPVCHSACGALTISFVDETLAGNCNMPTTVTRHWTATDVCGNSTIAQQTITIQPDQTPPSFAALPEPITMSCAQGAMPDFATPVVTDNCASGTALTITHLDTWSNGGNLNCASQTVTRTWTATDACGNAVTASQSMTIVDDVAPVFTSVPAGQAIGCNDPVEFGSVTVTDGCSSFTIATANNIIPSACSQQHIRTWTATDACGNSITASQSIVQTDEQAPVFTSSPDNQTINCGAPVEFDGMEATDNCGVASLTHVDEVLPLACGEEHIRTWTATDACGQTAIAQQKITVTDTEAPVFTTPIDNQTIECGQPVEFANPSVSDNCGSVAMTMEDGVTSTNCGEVFTRTWKLVDACGNEAFASQTITEADTEAPVFEPLPTELTMTQAEFEAWLPPTAAATDNCHSVNIETEMLATGNCETASRVFTYTASDGCGNTAQHELTVVITDAIFGAEVQLPSLLDCGGGYELTANAVNGTAPYTYEWAVVDGEGWEIANANAGTATILAGNGTATISLTVTDAIGCGWLQAYSFTCSGTALGTDEAQLSDFLLLPNPANEHLTVRFASGQTGEATLRITNALGEVVLLRKGVATIGMNEERLDVSGLSAGTYFLSLQVGEGVETARFVKVK